VLPKRVEADPTEIRIAKLRRVPALCDYFKLNEVKRMADQTVKIANPNDGKHRVAYEMAIALWRNEHGASPKMSTQEEFLDLVKDCMYALNSAGQR
jgi:hypothetical protein